MSSPKPDYFIASNGLPNILNKNNSTRQMIRQIPTATLNTRNQRRNLNSLHKDESSSGNNNNTTKCLKNKHNFMEMLQAPTSTIVDKNKRNHLNLKKSRKDLINSEIKANSHENSTYNFLSTSPQKIEADNSSKCTWNFERYSKEVDNKYTHQRKYDNTIFRHDLPDRIVLPSLPI